MKYIGTQHIIELIQSTGLEKMLVDIAAFIEEDYKRWGHFGKSPRYAHHTDNGVIELMPTADDHYFSFKYVNGHPENFRKKLQTIVAFGVLSDVPTGYPLLLSEMTIGTAMRTAAMSALAAKYLARKNSKSMTLIGTGCQAEFQAYAFRALLDIKDLRIFDIDPAVMKKFERNMEGAGFSIHACTTPEEAVQKADIITTCTADKQFATILSDNMVGQGVHINAVGGDCPGKTELHPDILKRGSVFVEYEEQSRIEGEIQHMPEDFPVTELQEIFTQEKPGRASENQITIFDSVGFAVQDFSYLRYLYQKIQENGFYDTLDILGNLDDPRDLFGVIKNQIDG